MSTMSPRQRTFVCGIIERTDGAILICRRGLTLDTPRPALRAGSRSDPRASPVAASPGRWVFPRSEVRPGESPEQAMRRAAREGVGLDVEISIGQPPVIEDIEGQPAIVRYYLCHVSAGEAAVETPRPPQADRSPAAVSQGLAYEEVRWVLPGQLCEYDFEPGIQKVVEWYTA